MSKITILNQPFSNQLGDYLIDQLLCDKYTNFTFATAFAKNSGVLRLKRALERFRDKGSSVIAFVGIDLGGTSYEALNSLFGLVDKLYVVHVESDQTFHPKIYSFKNDSEGSLAIGSNNMTGGGLWTNFECSALLDLKFSESRDWRVQEQANETFTLLEPASDNYSKQINMRSEIEDLLLAGYVEKEVTTHLKRAKRARQEPKTAARQDNGVLFGKSIAAPIPNPPKPHKIVDSLIVSDPADEMGFSGLDAKIIPLTNNDYQVVWFETRAMTGGSSNQLDISMKAAVLTGDPSNTEFDLNEQNTMRGGAQFFGISPQDTNVKKEITINYNGVDYSGNTLLFYNDGKRPNGSWRLQIKGISAEGVSFTSVIEKGYLKYKVLAFTKVEEDYYFLTIFPESDLNEFKKASTLVAHNGISAQSRLFGLL